MSGADYFTYTNLIAGTTARASDVNSRMAAIQGAFARLPHYEKLQQGRSTAVSDTGAANALIANLDFAPSSYVFGLELTVRVAVTNTGPSTVNINGLGAKSIVRADGSPLKANDLVAGRIVHLVFDGSNFQVLGASELVAQSAETAAAASATAAAASAAAAAASATAANTSATNAATSATNAATSAAAAAAAVSGYVAKAGSTMTGPLILSGAPSTSLQAATKQYVDDAVFAAGSFTADGATITLSAGQFSLTTIANSRLFGNVSGGTAKPGALTGTQATALLDTFSASAKGLVASPGASTGRVLKDDGSWTTDITGNAATATKLATPRTIAISGAVTGSATSFDGSANITITITALDVGAATTGTLAIARGGTGVTTSTGTGSNVLSTSPTFTGTVALPTVTATGNVSLTTYGSALFFKDNGGSTPALGIDGANNHLALWGTGATGTLRKLFDCAMRSDSSTFDFLVGVTAPSPSAGDNSVRVSTTAYVQGELANYSPARVAMNTTGSSFGLIDGHNNQLITLTGTAGGQSITAGTLTTGTAVMLVNISSAAWTFSCAGGVYTDGATATVASASIPAGARCTAVHLGGGQWLLNGV